MSRTTPLGVLRALGVVASSLLLTGCGGTTPTAAPALPTTATPVPAPATEPSLGAPPAAVPASPGTVAPPWLGTRVLPAPDGRYGEVRATPRALRDRRFTLPDQLPALPGTGFAARVVDPAPDDVVARSTWGPGCPVGRDDLAWVRVAFRGFDGSRHTGELLVNASVADDVVTVFTALWDDDFPIEQMHVTSAAELDLPPTGDGNNTGSFVCRPVTGGTAYSQHAYGLAIDVDPFQNPYTKGDLVLPELASAYLDRGDVRVGMHEPDGPAVRAFASVGWTWGGTYRALKDYQHFSEDGG